MLQIKTIAKTVILVFIMFVAGCDNKKATKFDKSSFTPESSFSFKYNVILCFDLRQDRIVQAGLYLRPDPNLKGTARKVALPFDSKHVMSDEEHLLTWGTYPGYTLISVYDWNTGSDYGISVLPKIASLPHSVENPDLFPDSIHIVRDGVRRRFYYKYPPSGRSKSLWNRITKHFDTKLDAVAVLLPEKHDPKIIPGYRSYCSISPIHSTSRRVDFFPGIGDARNKILQIWYTIPLTKAQEDFIYSLLGTGAGIVPLAIGLLFVSKQKIKSRFFRILILTLVLIVEIVLLIVFIYMISKYGLELRVADVMKVFNAVLAGIFAGIIARKVIKEEK